MKLSDIIKVGAVIKDLVDDVLLTVTNVVDADSLKKSFVALSDNTTEDGDRLLNSLYYKINYNETDTENTENVIEFYGSLKALISNNRNH